MEATGTGLRRVLRCMETARSTVGRREVPVRNWICTSPSCGLRLTVGRVGRVLATVVAVAALRAVAVRTVALAAAMPAEGADTPAAVVVDTQVAAVDTPAAEAVIARVGAARSEAPRLDAAD